MSKETQKAAAAKAAMAYVKENMTLGVGTGSTVKYFIDYLAASGIPLNACVASSEETANLLKAHRLPVIELTSAGHVDLYVDGADEFNEHRYMIKGGGAALTREKIIASSSEFFICIADKSKYVHVLGQFPLPVEVIPMARSLAGRSFVKMGGNPVYREGCITDNGNIILDVYNLHLEDPIKMEEQINNIPGVVGNGLFAHRRANLVLMATDEGIQIFKE